MKKIEMTECDLIELGSLSQIQNNGFVVCTHFQKESMRMCIRSVSSNIGEASFSSTSLRHDPRLFVGKCVQECFSTQMSRKMSTLLERHLGKKATYCAFSCDSSDHDYFITLTKTRDGIVFEIIPDDSCLNLNILKNTKGLAKLTEHTKLATLFDAGCAMVLHAVDYDRAMIYEFQEDFSGKVVYERIKPEKSGTLDSYMGMYFPASDIPLPARQLFMIQPMRVVFDNDSDSVPMTNEVDLSKCTLRATHPVHSTYMKNMGVRSSMTIAIILDDQLWGLICFHAHEEAVIPRGWEVAYFESLGTYVSSCISKIYGDSYQIRQCAVSSVVDKGFVRFDSVSAYFAENALDLLRVMNADCLCVRHLDQVQSWGDADLAMTADALEHASRDAIGKAWVLSELTSPSRGVLCMAHKDTVVGFARRTRVSDKLWGGDPFHVKLLRPDGVPGPRGSFERYVQSGADSLNSWNRQDQRVASYLSSRLKLLLHTEHSIQVHRPHQQRPQGQVGYHTTPTRVGLDPAILSHFSHELNTPVHGVSSALTLLMEDVGLTSSETREHLLHALKCVKSISKIVEGVLAIAGGSEFSKTTRNLERLDISVFIDALSKEFGDKTSFVCTSTVDQDHDCVLVDTHKLREAMCAIINNSLLCQNDEARKSTRMSVSCCSTHREAILAWKNETKVYSHRNIRNSEDTFGLSDADVWYTFSVQDSGCGIHRDMLDNVLVASRDKAGTASAITNSHQGVGIDIYRCISLIFEMNGSIGIASTVSKGTSISVMLPAQVVTAVSSNTEKQTNISAKDLGAFLIVDDNAINRKLATKLVAVACKKKLGVTPVVKAFSDGKLCVEEVNRMRSNGEKIMGILMDHHMPVMSGREATAIIREAEMSQGIAQIPIIGFTADSTGDTKAELLRSGMNNVLQKPLSMRELEETCGSLIPEL